MRYGDAVQPLATGGMLESRVMTIAATGKAFRNLMDGLYSRKIEAFCRELLTNAFDSHCAAGTPDRQFLVTVPSIFDKRMRVRDFGVGMSHDMVMDIYSVLFQSTKDTSDDEVGMFGLGKGSPFAYTDGFSLRCWDGQEVRVYSIYLGPKGVPQIDLAARAPSTEPRGVEVSVPVAQEDWPEVNKALARVCVGFPNPPKLPYAVETEMKFEASLHGTGWAAGHCEALGRGVFARQGCVIYPIPAHELNKHAHNWSSERDTMCIVIDFPIGELDITPSRETLSLNGKTSENIKKRFLEFLREASEDLVAHFKHMPTKWERTLAWENMKFTDLPAKIKNNFPQRKEHVEVSSYLHDVMKLTNSKRRDPTRWTYIRLGHHGGGSTAHREHAGLEYSVSTMSDRYGTAVPQLPDDEKDLVFLVDEKKNNDKIAHWMSRQGIKRALVLRKNTGSHAQLTFDFDGKQYSLSTSDEEVLLKSPVWEKLGNPPVLRVSKFPPPPKVVRVREDNVEAGMEWVHGEGFRTVNKARLQELRRLGYKFLFYSRRRNAVVTPAPFSIVSYWGEKMRLERETESYAHRLSQIIGGDPNLAMVRMLPRQRWSDVKDFPEAVDPEKIFLDKVQPGYWDDAIPWFLWDTYPRYCKYDPEFYDLLRIIENRKVQTLVRVNTHCYGMQRLADAEGWTYRTKMVKARGPSGKMQNISQTVYNPRPHTDRVQDCKGKASLLKSMMNRNPEVFKVFLREAKARGYHVPIYNQFFSSLEDMPISGRWNVMIKRSIDFLRNFPEREQKSVFESLYLLELEAQAKGGRLS